MEHKYIMKLTKLGLLLITTAAMLTLAPGCGKKVLPPPPKSENYDAVITQSIETFLLDKSYGLKLEKLETFKIDGNNAYAIAVLKGLKNNWEFTLSKSAGGTWAVVAYDIKK
jgi:hypothetical protein